MNRAWRLLLCSSLLFAVSGPVAVAQDASAVLAPATRQRVEALLRSKVSFPPETSLTFKVDGPSDLPGFDKLSSHYSSALTGASGEVPFLISKDGTRLIQLTNFDIAADPRTKIPTEGGHVRGGPAAAPVLIVGFDDLQCPFCALLHQKLFPALTDRYKDQVRVVYQSLPSDGHPWAMHAAIDTDCLGEQSPEAYWAAVDKIHEHAGDYGGKAMKLSAADHELDADVMEQGRRFHVNESALKACMDKQDEAAEKKSIALAGTLGVVTTPTFFVNGARFEGNVSLGFVFDAVDNALRAEGQVPPPRQDRPEPKPAAAATPAPAPGTP